MSNSSNIVNETSMKRFFGELKRLHEESESAKGRYMSECKTRRDRRVALLDSADSAGVPKKELRTIFKRFLLEQKIDALDDEFDDATVYETMVDAFGKSGDLPLFAGALEAAKQSKGAKVRKAKADAIDSLTDDVPDIVAANVDALNAGLHPLN